MLAVTKESDIKAKRTDVSLLAAFSKTKAGFKKTKTADGNIIARNARKSIFGKNVNRISDRR
jgi:hypothetical protein